MRTRFANPGAANRHPQIMSLAGLLLVLSFATNVQAHEVKHCRDITAPGQYLLANDLFESQAGTACLRIHDTQNVTLDCQLHTVTGGIAASAITVTNVEGFAITRCTLESTEGSFVLTATNSSEGSLTGNTIGNLTTIEVIQFESVDDTSVVGNTLNAPFQQYYSSGNVFRANTATCPKSETCAALFVSGLGSSNTIAQNKIDGQGSSQTYPYGADDGIFIEDESGDVLSGNTIQNTWDTGIETEGNIVNTHIKSNIISSVAYAGIGGWYWNSWDNVSVIDNTVTNTAQMFALFRTCGLRPQNWDGNGAPADTAVYFHNNVFSGNQFVGSEPLDDSAFIPIFDELDYPQEEQVCGIPGEQPVRPSDFKLHNNTFTQNNFGHVELSPYFSSPVKPGFIIDGGGNVCSSPGSPYPLLCN
jgi:parallel beta-helix repeat protein